MHKEHSVAKHNDLESHVGLLSFFCQMKCVSVTSLSMCIVHVSHMMLFHLVSKVYATLLSTFSINGRCHCLTNAECKV